MAGLNHRFRAVIHTALTWAAAWGLIGAAVGAAEAASLGLLSRFGIGFALTAAAEPALACSIAGALSGALFGCVFLLAERRRGHIEELRIARVAMWGAIGAMILPASVSVLASAHFLSAKAVALTGAFALLGGGSGAATLLLARRRPSAGVPRVSSASSATHRLER
jgi:hypothetical protein